MGKVKVKSEERIFDGYLKIDKAEVVHEKNDGSIEEYSRFKLSRPDAVAALIVNSEKNTITLIRQFRYPVSNREEENILEIVAGKIDVGENPTQAMIRELEEEVGYKITEKDLKEVCSVYVSPGYTTEKFHLFIIEVTDEMKISDGGGLASEHEDIEIVEMSIKDFLFLLRTNKLIDAKTNMVSCHWLIQTMSETLDSLL